MFETLFAVSFIANIVAGYVLYKSLSRLSFLEDFYEDIYRQFKPVTEAAKAILSSDVYSNEPVVVNFVENLKDVDHYLQQISPEYNLEAENPDEPVQ
jgi:ABC-type molybdate transport system permease subunit